MNLNSFNAPVLGAGYADVLDTLRETDKAVAAGAISGLVGQPVGALNWANPGAVDRTLTQSNGTSLVPVTPNLSALKVSGAISLGGLAGCVVAGNIGAGNPGFGFDNADFQDFDRTLNRWRLAIGNSEKIVQDNDDFYNLTATCYQRGPYVLYKYGSKTDAPLDQKNWVVGQSDTKLEHFLQNDARTTNDVYDKITRTGLAVTTRHLNQTSGRLLVGQGVVDDGVTGLQTSSIRALQQAKVTLSGGSVTATGGVIAYDFSQIIGTPAGLSVDLANNVVTVNQPGEYMLVGATWNFSYSGGADLNVVFLRNGGSFTGAPVLATVYCPVPNNYGANICGVFSLAAGDFFQIVLVSSGSPSNIAAELRRLSIYRLP
jgi:hypothetical protein